MTITNVSTEATESMRFTYDAEGYAQTINYQGTVYYYVTNVQGDVIGIIRGNGTQVVAYRYDAWGNVKEVTGSMSGTLGKANPLRYRGYVYDEETKLYYLESRYYDPEVGRWINADDTAYLGADGTLLSNNLFAYCGNSPVNKIDKTGNLGLAIGLFIGVSAVIGGLTGAFTAACTGGSVLEGALEGAALGAVAATATIFVPLALPKASAAVVGVVTFATANVFGMGVDWLTQRVSHELSENANEEFEADVGRMIKTGVTTGISSIVPAYGEPSLSVFDSAASLVIGFDVSFISAAVDIAFTSLLR